MPCSCEEPDCQAEYDAGDIVPAFFVEARAERLLMDATKRILDEADAGDDE